MSPHLVALLLFAAPNPTLTPGEVDASVTQERICTTRTRDRRHVTQKTRKAVFARYGIPWERRAEFETDHLIPLCAGGSNAETNLWPELWIDAHEKDKLEVRLCRSVCKGEVSLADAQEQLRTWGQSVDGGTPR